MDEQIGQSGYKRPPVHTQFKPGRSGNPSGRPKNRQTNLAEMFENEGATLLPVVEGGKRRKISKLHAIVKQLINKAVQGDAKATALLLSTLGKGQTSSSPETLSPVLQELRALNAKHEAADRNGRRRDHDED